MINRGAGQSDNDEPADTFDTVVVGAGKAGRRFIHAIRYIEATSPRVLRLAGVVDRKGSLDVAVHEQTSFFADLGEALRSVRPDIAVVCVNEQDHHAVLHQLCAADVPVILCEKPLTATTAEAEALQHELLRRFVSVNLVERFSPIVEAARDWLAGHTELTLRRIEFFWGKHRVKDARPTIGAYSELIHPIDLVRHIFGLETLEVRTAFGVISDIQGAETVHDSLSVMMVSGQCAILGQASFAWPGRDRRIVAYVGGKEALYRLTLQFDVPRWDCDRMIVSRIDVATSIYTQVFNLELDNDDFPADLRGINKVKRFVEASLAAARGEADSAELVGVKEAIDLQRVLDNIVAAAVCERVWLCE